MSHKIKEVGATTLAGLAFSVVTGATLSSASATTAKPDACPTQVLHEVDDEGISGYQSLGPAVGLHNSSPSSGDLTCSLSETSTKATS